VFGRRRAWKVVGQATLASLCSLSVVSMLSTAGAGASTKGPYVVGATEDLSGALAAYGKWVQSTWTASFNAANQSGGVNGRKIKLAILDDQSNVTTAVSNAKQLLSENPVLMTGSTISNICAAVAPLGQTAKTPVNCLNITPNELQPLNPWLFDRNPPEVTTAKPVINFIPTAVHGAKPKIGILVAAVGGAIDFGNELQKLAQQKGWTVTDYEQSSSSSTAPPPSQLAKLASSDPNVIVTENTPAETEAELRQLRTDGFKGALISQDSDYVGLNTLKDPGYYTLSDNLFITPGDNGSGAKSYIAQMKSAGITGTSNLNTGQLTLDWIQGQDIVAALKKCAGSCTGAQMQTALQTTKISLPGVINSFGYTSTDHIPLASEYIYGYSSATHGVKLFQTVSLGSL
jgi:branched-chain amino acid transport system substrate-binding protein